MAQLLLLLTGALVVGVIVFGVTVLITGGDGLGEVEPDGQSVPLPAARPLVEEDVAAVRFDTAVRGYRMAQVDQALRRAAYDIGYKDELIQVLEAEVVALREGRTDDADALREARDAAVAGGSRSPDDPDDPAGADGGGPAASAGLAVAAADPADVEPVDVEPAEVNTGGVAAADPVAAAAETAGAGRSDDAVGSDDATGSDDDQAGVAGANPAVVTA
jgi:DivIVA domain-containing protein